MAKARSVKAGVSGVILASRAQREEFDALRAQITAQRAKANVPWDALWELVGRALSGDPPVYRARYRSQAEFVRKELPGESVRSVERNVTVARCFSAADETRHGASWLEEVALYAKALARAEEPPEAIDLDRLKIPVSPRGTKVTMKPARDCTRHEVQRARRRIAPAGVRSTTSPREKTLRTELTKVKALRGVSVRTTVEAVTLGAVPWSALGALGRALARLKLPRGK